MLFWAYNITKKVKARILNQDRREKKAESGRCYEAPQQDRYPRNLLVNYKTHVNTQNNKKWLI